MVSFPNIIFLSKGRIPMFSPSLGSCEVKENLEDAMNLVDEINDLVGDLGCDSSLSFNEAEHHTLEGTRALGQKLFAHV